jgi:hypothetical protein
MVASNERVKVMSWTSRALVGLWVSIVSFAAFVCVSRFAVPSLKGPGDFPALFLCAAAGTLPGFRSGSSTLAKLCFAIFYVLVTVILLGMSAWWFDCLVLHDCD